MKTGDSLLSDQLSSSSSSQEPFNESSVGAGDEYVVALQELASLAKQMGFFNFIALVERVFPHAVRVGEDGPVTEECIRFSHSSALHFPSGDIEEARAKRKDASRRSVGIEVESTFLGLSGASSPLPLHFAEAVLQEENTLKHATGSEAQESSVQRDFLNLFHHRLLSLLYRARVRYWVAGEFRSDANDSWSTRLLSLVGLHEENELRRHQLLRLLPLLLGQRGPVWSTAAALQSVLAPYINGAPVEIQEFTGAWYPLEREERIVLGHSHCTLGKDAVLGSQLLDSSGHVTIRIGPLQGNSYRAFVKDSSLQSLIRETLRILLDEPLDFDIELRIAPSAVPPSKLGSGETALGQSAWLQGPPEEKTIRLR